MLGKPGEQHTPALIAGRIRHIFEQPQTSPRWLLVVLLQELNDQPPLRVEVWLCSDKTSQTGKSHRLVTHIHRVANPGENASGRRTRPRRVLAIRLFDEQDG